MSVPNKIRLEACNMCQLKCPLCDTPKRKEHPSVLGYGYLKFEKFKELIEKNPSIKQIDLSWLGEIFLSPDLKEIIRYSFSKGIILTANGGVNFNNISQDLLKDLVKYRFFSITVAIDGTTQKTYAKYRQRGSLKKVLSNIMLLNKFKKQYRSDFPFLQWQYIVFGHNEHEISTARDIAKKLNMSFSTKMSWDTGYSPVRNRELVLNATGENSVSREEYASKHGKDYQDDICRQLWEQPQINWDGNLFGCCKNQYMSFGNVFEQGLEAVLNSEKYNYMKEMVLLRKPPRADIICTKCIVFHNRQINEMKKIVLYYHHFGGYGHGMRIYSICKALKSIGKYKILVINSGVPQPELNIKYYAKVYNLPPVKAADSLFSGLSSGLDIEKTFQRRKLILNMIMSKFKPNLAIIEHFPFGRLSLKNEIIEFIHQLKQKDCRIYSSVRDLILSKGAKEYFDQFNGIFIHEDPEFGYSDEAPKNSFFTGRVHPYDLITPPKENNLKRKLDPKSKKLIIASIGGGLDGHELLTKLINVKIKLDKKCPSLLMIFTGNTFPDDKYLELENNLPADCKLIRFDSNLMDYVHTADLFISMAGYNSLNSHLLTDTPSMLFPRLSDQEQSIRAELFGFKCYNYATISEEELLKEINSKLSIAPEVKKLANLNGAQTTARFITKALSLKSVKIRITTKCDLNCSMCSWRKKDEQLDKNKIYTLLDDISMLSVKSVNFTGGEPTTHSNIEDIVKYAKAKGLQVSLSTNGFNQSMLTKIIPYLDFADISIDSYQADLNDNIRGKKGAFYATIDSVRFLAKNKIKPHINVTVRPDNYKGLHKIIKIFNGQISSISFTLVDTNINKMKNLDFTYDELKMFYFDEVVEILKMSVMCIVPIRITPFFGHLDELNSFDILFEILHNKQEYLGRFHEIFRLTEKDCHIAKERLRINANGDVRPCCYLDDEDIPLGNINNNSLKEIVTNNKYFYETLQAKAGIGLCSACKKGYTRYEKLCLSKV